MSKMNIKKLRSDCPEWAWKAERNGTGWVYVGQRGEERVTVYPVGVWHGPSDDDYETQWRVEETGERLWEWILRAGGKLSW